jgi:hypothetical protein
MFLLIYVVAAAAAEFVCLQENLPVAQAPDSVTDILVAAGTLAWPSDTAVTKKILPSFGRRNRTAKAARPGSAANKATGRVGAAAVNDTAFQFPVANTATSTRCLCIAVPAWQHVVWGGLGGGRISLCTL